MIYFIGKQRAKKSEEKDMFRAQKYLKHKNVLSKRAVKTIVLSLPF